MEHIHGLFYSLLTILWCKVCVSSLVIDEIKRIIKSSEILKYTYPILTNGSRKRRQGH